MTKTTLTLVLGGEVPLDRFAEGMQGFRQLIEALTQEVSGGAKIAWVIDELAGGSAVATIRGEAEQIEDVERVVRAYAVVGKALERHEVIPYSERVAKAARKLASVLDGNVTSLQFETETETAMITEGIPYESWTKCAAFGTVEGRVETLRSRHRLSFTLYDSINDEAVYCLLRPEQVELVRNAWGKRVIVEGWVERDPASGRPIKIDPVESITILPELVPGAYRQARAVAPAPHSAPSPADAMRRLRDA
jgi:hypothetical protein